MKAKMPFCGGSLLHWRPLALLYRLWAADSPHRGPLSLISPLEATGPPVPPDSAVPPDSVLPHSLCLHARRLEVCVLAPGHTVGPLQFLRSPSLTWSSGPSVVAHPTAGRGSMAPPRADTGRQRCCLRGIDLACPGQVSLLLPQTTGLD